MDDCLKGISNLTSLERLSLRDCFKVSNGTFCGHLVQCAPTPSKDMKAFRESASGDTKGTKGKKVALLGSLTALDISGTRIDTEGIESVLRWFPTLKEITANNCKGITAEGIGMILEASNLQKISLYNLLASSSSSSSVALPLSHHHHSSTTIAIARTAKGEETIIPPSLHVNSPSTHPTPEKQEKLKRIVKKLGSLSNITYLDIGKLPLPVSSKYYLCFIR